MMRDAARAIQIARAALVSLILGVVRRRAAGPIVGWMFAHMASLLPLDHLAETDLVVAFRHPRPSYPVHILIVPKRFIPSFLALTDADLPMVQDALAVARRLVHDLHLEQTGYRFVVNGGPYQDVPQLHFHLISGSA